MMFVVAVFLWLVTLYASYVIGFRVAAQASGTLILKLLWALDEAQNDKKPQDD